MTPTSNTEERTNRDRIGALEEAVAGLEGSLRRTAWEGWTWLGWCLFAVLILGAATVPVWALTRGSWGHAGLVNSGREALRWGRTYWPTLEATSVYCEDGSDGEDKCVLNFPDHTRWTVQCDDDALGQNDGCDTPTYVPPVLPRNGVPGATLTAMPNGGVPR